MDRTGDAVRGDGTPDARGPLERPADAVSARRVLLLATLALLPVLALALLWVGRNAFFLLFAGILFAALLDTVIGALHERTKLSRGWSSAIVIGALLLLLAALGWMGGSTLAARAGDLYGALDQQADRIGNMIERVRPGERDEAGGRP